MTFSITQRINNVNIGLLEAKGDPALDTLAGRLRRRFDVDAVFIGFVDRPGQRSVLKGMDAPDLPGCRTRDIPISRSLCNLVMTQDAPLRLHDVAAQIDPDISTASRALGMRSYLGVPLRDELGEAIGALGLITTRATRAWTRAEEEDLILFAQIVDNLIAQRVTEARLERAVAGAICVSAARQDAILAFNAMAANLPGITLRYALFEDGTDAVEDPAGDLAAIWGYTWAEMAGDTEKLWSAVEPDERPGVLASLQQSAARNEPWCYQWHIRNRTGARRLLRAYGTPTPLEGGIGTVWNLVVLDLTRIAEDKDRLTRAA